MWRRFFVACRSIFPDLLRTQDLGEEHVKTCTEADDDTLPVVKKALSRRFPKYFSSRGNQFETAAQIVPKSRILRSASLPYLRNGYSCTQGCIGCTGRFGRCFCEVLSVIAMVTLRLCGWGPPGRGVERDCLELAWRSRWAGRPLPRGCPCTSYMGALRGGGKSELRRAVCRITSGIQASRPGDGKCHREDTALRA